MSLARHVIVHVPPVQRHDDAAKSRQFFEQDELEFALAPMRTVRSVDLQVRAAVLVSTREALIVGPHRPVNEAIAGPVSVINIFPFLIKDHSTMICEDITTGATAACTSERNEDAQTACAVCFARGAMEQEDAFSFGSTTDEADLAASATAAALFHYLHRVVNEFARDGSPLADEGVLYKLRMTLAASETDCVLTGGAASSWASLARADATPPAGIQRVDARPSIGPAPAEISRAAPGSLERHATPFTNTPRTRSLSDWHCDQPPLRRTWFAEASSGNCDADLPVATLALWGGDSAYSVTDVDITVASSIQEGDVELVGTLGLGARVKSRRPARWIGGTP